MALSVVLELALTLLLASVTADEAFANAIGASGAECGYSLESLLALPQDEFEVKDLKNLVLFCAQEKKCSLLEVALEKFPLGIDDSEVGAIVPLDGALEEYPLETEGSDMEVIDVWDVAWEEHPLETDSSEVEVVKETFSSDVGRRGRLLAGTPDRYGWANGDTHHCTNEGGYCHCDGNVVYTRKCRGVFSCNRANWRDAVSRRWNSNHRSNVKGGIWCTNGAFGGDPWSGYDKQCFCHPRQTVKTRFEYLEKWSKGKCFSTCGKKGNFWDFWKGFVCGINCTGGCTTQALAFVSGRYPQFDFVGCPEYCYCVAKGWTA